MTTRNQLVIGIVLIAGLFLILFGPEGVVFSVLSLSIDFIIVILTSEPIIEGLKELSISTGLSPHITGLISSLASNLPEVLMTAFMIFSPEL